MPPKRKAPVRTTSDAQNQSTSKPAKASKSASTQAKSMTSTANVNPPSRTKFSNADTLEEKPEYLNLDWRQDIEEWETDEEDEGDEKDEQIEGEVDANESKKDSKGKEKQELDLPKTGELLTEAWVDRVSDMGFPISKDGRVIMEKFSDQLEVRNQDILGLHIYTDWNGYGYNECVENLLKDFNRDLYKKTISPYKKWAYVEGFAAYLKMEGFMEVMMVDDADGVLEIINMIGTMILTSFEMLSEHNLLTAESDIKNIPIISLIMLEFFKECSSNFDLGWAYEVVRLCDQAGIDLTKAVKKQVDVGADQLKEWREAYEERQCNEEDNGENEYIRWAQKKTWTPKDDGLGDDRMWYRWDWKLEYKEFKKNHPGGTRYDLSKMSKGEKAQYSYRPGPDDDMEMDSASDDDYEFY